jgi:2-iminoacetate synthase
MLKYTALQDGFFPQLAAGAALADGPGRPTADDARRALAAERLGAKDFLALLSPAAEPFLEEMALRAREETLRHFGRSVQLFTPLYLANFCTNRCVYCGFNARRAIRRRMLSLEQLEEEALAIAATGLRRILVLTGDAPGKTGAAYLASCVAALTRHFSSVGIETPSMTVREYAGVAEAGADSMTMFQETYNEILYAALHPAGPKRDFAFRLDAPQRAILGGMRCVNLGALLGLDHWRRDVFLTGLHAAFLQSRYPEQEIGLSLPRLRPCGEAPDGREEREFSPKPVGDRHFVQILTALRCFLPQAGITLSTREPANLRDRLIPLGVTRVSAGVSTAVGGHAAEENPARENPQFDISDSRSVDEMAAAISSLGYQPVFSDWLLAAGPSLSAGVRAALAPDNI